jgi:hypothetical protein
MKGTRKNAAGFSMIEAVAGLGLLATGLLTLASSTVTGSAGMRVNAEGAAAVRIARDAIARLHTGDVEFKDMLAHYTTGIYDPARETWATPGARSFDVTTFDRREATVVYTFPPIAEGLDLNGDPVVGIREDLLKRDVNGDGVVQAAQGAIVHDYKMLPITVTVTWTTGKRTRTVEEE